VLHTMSQMRTPRPAAHPQLGTSAPTAPRRLASNTDIKSEELTMSVVPEAEPETVSNATTNPPVPFELVSDNEGHSVGRPQSQMVLQQVSPSKARTLFVVACIAAIATVAGLILWAALSNP
jgi:hypothetical protein